MPRAVQNHAAVGHDGATFKAWWAGFGRLLRFPVLDLSVSEPVKPDLRAEARRAAQTLGRYAALQGSYAEGKAALHARLRAEHDAGWPLPNGRP